jgi:GNAT superfamily N-acetyltransferase
MPPTFNFRLCGRLSQLSQPEKIMAFLRRAPFWSDNIDNNPAYFQALLSEAGQWRLLERNRQWLWLSAVQELTFDSNLFRRKMGNLAPIVHKAAWPAKDALAQGAEFWRRVLLQAEKDCYQFLMARVNSRDVLAAQSLEAAGFRLLDVSVEWELDLAALPDRRARAGYTVAPWREEDLACLPQLAGEAFCDLDAYADRFSLDPHLRPHSVRFYQTWMRNCLNGQQADQVLVVRAEEKCLGFIALRLPNAAAANGWVALNALRPDARGRKLYSHLLLHGLHWLRENGAKLGRVRTKINQLAVINAWKGLGARQVWSDITLHWWNERDRPA